MREAGFEPAKPLGYKTLNLAPLTMLGHPRTQKLIYLNLYNGRGNKTQYGKNRGGSNHAGNTGKAFEIA